LGGLKASKQPGGLLHRGIEHLAPSQGDRLDECLADGDPDGEVQVAWRCYQQLRATYRARDTTEGKRSAEGILEALHTCPIPEIARLGRTLHRWKKEFLGYFTTDRANNGGTEAICESGFGWSGTGWSGWMSVVPTGV